MGLSGDADLARKHVEVCHKLNLESKIIAESWESFQIISRNFTLEGDPLNWFGCAIYETCWKSVTPTVGQTNLRGNCTNLTTLLRYCNLSLAQFFFDIRQWSDMARLPEEFTKKIDHLEMTFAVSYNVFKEYQPLFLRIFRAPEPLDPEQLKQHRNRKQKPVPCTTSKIFEFCWTLFTTIKGEDSTYSNDLVTSCHLLIAICDWAFRNAFLSDRRDLLNPQFEGLPHDWSSPSYEVPADAPCIISKLCASNDNVMVTDVKYIKEYPFRTFVKNLFERGLLTGKDEDCTDVFDPSVFESNFKKITQAYEISLFSKGEFDERMFLAEYRRKLLEKDQNSSAMTPSPQDSGDISGPECPREMVVDQGCMTPLTGRMYLGPRESHDGTLFSNATESISRLNTLLSGRQAGPSEALVQLFESCASNPTEKITEIVTALGERFVTAYASEQTEFTTRRLQLGITLFYKLIESILQNEKTIRADISAIVDKNVFYECMFACSLEIVIYSYSSGRKFPWILDALGVQPYNFVKVIELIIRSKDQLSRDIIKHLNMVEETIISSLVWKTSSPIWEAIEGSAQPIPKFEETALPSHLQNEQGSGASCLRKILNSEPKQIQSPGPSATDRFQSPVTQSNLINRQLFPIQSGQSLLQKTTHLMIKDKNGVTKMIPIVSSDSQNIHLQQAQQKPVTKPDTPPSKPKRTGGLSIIFRKFYTLAGERMEHLCTQLNILNVEIKRKIWTVFEECVRKNNCELIKDRNLDQLLMCAVYMICKLNNSYNRSFADIMKSYRTQPQATSDIYRNVLIRNKWTELVDGDLVDHPAERSDLIKFYNLVVIQAMKKFAEKFVYKGNDTANEVPLSPLPASRRQLVSPGVQVIDNVFVKPLESPTTGFGNGKIYNYYFNRSPSKDLKDINKAIKGNGVTGKRLLVEGENDMPSSKRNAANRKVQSLIEERRNQNSE